MTRTATKKSYSITEVSKVLNVRKSVILDFAKEGVFNYTSQQKKRVNRSNYKRIETAANLHHNLGVKGAGVQRIFKMQKKLKKLQKSFNSYLSDIRKGLGSQLEMDLKVLKRAKARRKKSRSRSKKKLRR